MAEALNALSTEQRKSVDLLEDLLEAVKGLRGRQRVGMLGRFGGALGRAAGLARSAAPVLAGAAVVGAAGYTLTQNQARRESETQPPSPSPVGNTRVGSDDAPPPIVQLSEEQREIYNQLESATSSGALTREQADRITVGLYYGTMTAEQAREEIVNNIAIPQANNVPAAGTSAAPALPAPAATLAAPIASGPTATPADSDVQTRRVDPIRTYIENRETEALRQYSDRIRDRLIQVSEANSQRQVPSDTVNRRVITAIDLLREGKLDEASAAAEEANTSLESERVRDRVTQEQARRLGLPAGDGNIAPSNLPVPVTPVAPETSGTSTGANADLVTRTSSNGMLKDSDSATPKSPIKNITAEPLAKDAPTIGSAPDLSGLSGMDLILKARTVTFKGDEIEFVGSASNQVARPGISTLPGSVTPRAAGGVINFDAGGTMPEPIASGGATQSEGSGSQQLAKEQEGAAETGSLTFASGVDPRIKKDIAQKVQQIESAFGKKLTITSGFRDPHRNAAAGGARNSAHTRANAVDIRFQGNEEETNKLVEAASAAGIGGIGVYRPGWVHLDIESKRVWGPDFSARTVPEWAKDTLRAHMTGELQKTPAGDAAGVEPVAASPASPSVAQTPSSGGEAEGGGLIASSGTTAAAPAPEPTGNEMGAAVAGASQENAVAERTPVPPMVTAVQSLPQAQPTPGAAVPDSPLKSVNDPGNVEPDDAAERYAKLFNMAA
jgi:hypothetical protein